MALFPQIAWKFLENRNNPAAFEPAPTGNESAVENKPVSKAAPSTSGSAVYTVELEGKAFVVKVSEGGDISHVATTAPQAAPQATPAPVTGGTPVTAPMAGNIWKVVATEGQNCSSWRCIIHSRSHENGNRSESCTGWYRTWHLRQSR